ncbi:hypothetical protein DVH24_002095 [Malus domestica]|uniref:Uncharacterized protein n=1 Tax=Malus domestica TaxID=3750 RepID=A0A498I9B6_MALDO|nr:hypothetical protein DVH24_002095 [Malus domestica]
MQFIRGGIGSIPKCLFIDLLAGRGQYLWKSVHELEVLQGFNEFGVDGGPAAKDLAPKFNLFKKNLSAKLGVFTGDRRLGFKKLDIFVMTSESYLQVDFWWYIAFLFDRRHGKVVRCMGKARVREMGASSSRSTIGKVIALTEEVATLKAREVEAAARAGSRDCSVVFGPGQENEYDFTGLMDVRPPNPNASTLSCSTFDIPATSPN